jgi:hypothetical protein
LESRDVDFTAVTEAQIFGVEALERERRFRALIKEKHEWGQRYHLGYELAWDDRAMTIISKELARLRAELRDEFGHHT